MAKSITARELRHHWVNKQEIALLDVREEGPYADSHPLFAISVPVSEIEMKLPALVPRLSAPIVVYDDGEGYAQRAIPRINNLGYQDVAVLEGGLSAYALVGEVYRDVGVPSKAFGELVEAINHTPSVSAREAKKILDDSASDVAVLDGRRFVEYNTMSIPRGRSCPNGELLYRFFEAVPSPETTVIVNCAGRTRSIVGTQTLINSGIPNKVVALRNGTIGWTLEGLELDTKKTERVAQPSAEASQRAREYASSWAEHVGVTLIDSDRLGQFAAESNDRSLYLLDVRDPEEYALGHPAGFTNAPGGQLVQATEEWVGVRGARLVLYDTDGVRARMTASWLVQLGWQVYVLDDGATVPDSLPAAVAPSWSPPKQHTITMEEFQGLSESKTVIDLVRSPVYRKGHIPGAWFASGPELARDLKTLPPGDGPIVLTSTDGGVAAANIEEARKSVGDSRQIFYLEGGTAAWVAAGHQLDTEERWLSEPVDVYKRPYEGTNNAREAMQGYLDWEYGLVAQLANDGIAGFHVVRHRR
ncbi:Rhodanese-like domain-containing protein [Aspergillus pseudoustus]|uniref:Rhodanese-like domain-containing protein n=1 Tax=Aspergillus pseudoustus TaxID=1810923 RepID=A0ABR4JVU9_9EURO